MMLWKWLVVGGSLLLIIRDLSLQPFTLSSLTSVSLYFSIADVSSPNLCFTPGFCKPTDWHRTHSNSNPISTHFRVWYASNISQIFIGPPYQQLPSRDETEIGAVLWWTAINGGYLSVLRLARNTTQKGAWSWEASIGHLIGYLIGHLIGYLIGHLLGCIIVL